MSDSHFWSVNATRFLIATGRSKRRNLAWVQRQVCLPKCPFVFCEVGCVLVWSDDHWIMRNGLFAAFRYPRVQKFVLDCGSRSNALIRVSSHHTRTTPKPHMWWPGRPLCRESWGWKGLVWEGISGKPIQCNEFLLPVQLQTLPNACSLMTYKIGNRVKTHWYTTMPKEAQQQVAWHDWCMDYFSKSHVTSILV